MKMNISAMPTECTLYLTDVCNFNCSGCRRQTIEKPIHKEIDLELVQRILQAYPTLEGFCIAGYGEPTLAKHFPEVVNYLLDNDKYVGIITNGTYHERLLQLKKAPNYISISLYGYNGDQYKEYVGANLFDKIIVNFKILKERFGNVGFSYFLNKDNYKRLDKVLVLCDELQPAFLNLTNYLAYDSKETEDTWKIIRISDVEVIKYIEERCNTRKYVNARPIYMDEKDKEFNCSSYGYVINLDGQGNIGGCQRQMPPSITYGNIFLEEDPYNNIQMQTLRKRINEEIFPHPNCANCFGRHNPKKAWERVSTLTSETNIDIAIMLLFHEKVDQTIECLISFIPSGKKIYILNNGSSKESISELKEFCKNYPQIKIFDSERNLGVSVGRNYLLQHTKEEWTFFVDNDIYITKNDWLQKFLIHLKNNQNIEVFIPRLFNLHENSFVTYFNWALSENKIVYRLPKNGFMSNFPGGASIINRNVFRKLGLYDDQMFVGFEDFEFAIRGLLNQTPIIAKLIDDIELVHDHRKILKSVDRNAVLVRYNEDSHQKSIDRIQKKYPDLDFQHEWRNWVKEQKFKLIEHGGYDLYTLTPEYNFGAKSKNRTITVSTSSVQPIELSTKIKDDLNGFLSKYQFDKILILQNSADPDRYNGVKLNGQVRILTLSDLAGLNFTNDFNYLLKDSIVDPITEKDKVIIILDHILEKLEDPRIILREIKKLLLLNKSNVSKVFSKGRTKTGIEYPQDETSYREWKEDELRMHLSSGGFLIRDSQNLYDNGISTLSFTISLSREKYGKYLDSLRLPQMNMYYLMCSNEHGKAKFTGGIGSYVEEAQKLFKKDEFGVLLVSTGNMLPSQNVINNERILTIDKFFDQQVIARNEIAEMLLKSIQVVQYIYPFLNILEVQDVEGFGYRLVQAKQSGLLSSEIMVQIVAHGSKIYLENASQRWLTLNAYEVIYKEKIALENADRVVFPTKFVNGLYQDAGYVFGADKSYFIRLPFEFHKFPLNQYMDVDTLIFYGKRYSMKGYDVFSEIVTLLDVEGFLGTNIKRIVLIGPFFPEMIKQNTYFESLKSRIEIIEVSTSREEAIKIIKGLHFHSICVLPYKADNHPYSVLEIVETGVPFIFAQAGGIPELLPQRFHNQLLGELKCDDLTRKLKSVLSLSNVDRYELYSSIFVEMNNSQIEINKKFANFNEPHTKKSISAESARIPIRSSLVVFMDSDIDNYNSQLINSINNQTLLPAKLFVVSNGNVDKDYIKKRINEKIQIEFSSSEDNYNKSKNNLLKYIDTDIVIILALRDVPKNDFIEKYSSYLQINHETQCVSSYLDLVDFGKDPLDSSLIYGQLKPIGEVGILDAANKNVIAHESSAFRTNFIKSVNGWEEDSVGLDDLLTFVKIKSNHGKIGTVTKSLVIRLKNDKIKLTEDTFFFQLRQAVNSFSLDKFDTYRLIGMIRSSGLNQTVNDKTELSDIEKYLITVQTLLLNGKINEANEIISNIDEKTLKSADRTLQNKINTIKKKTDEIIKKIGVTKQLSASSIQPEPKVSVIIPTYNRPVQLKETIESVLDQTYKNFEILVVNDAGQDVSSLIKSFNDQRIKYFFHKKNKGLSGARNTGLNNASGQYISFLDDDDIFYPNHLQTLVAAIQNNPYKVVYADAYRCIQKKENDTYVTAKKELQYSLDYSQRILLIMNIAPVQCFLFDRTLLDGETLFDESLTTHEDWEFWIKLSIISDFLHIKEVTSEYRHRVDNTNMVTTKLPDFLRTMKIIYDRHSNSVMGHNEILAHQKRRILELEEQIRKESADRSCSIVIVTYNSEKDIINCVKSVKNTLRAKDEVILVDNNSADNTKNIVKNFIKNKPNVRLIENKDNLGFSAGTNVGIRDAKNPYVILLNPDTMVTGNWIDSLIAHMEKDNTVGAAGPISNYVAGLQKMELYTKEKMKGRLSYEEVYKLYKSWNDGLSVESKILLGFCLIIRKNVIEELGLLDEKLFLGNDDLDLSWRLRLKNYKLLVACDTFVYHKGQQSFKTAKKSRTDQLVQESTNLLYDKLEQYYGAGNIPTPIELWGMDWFKPSNPKYNPDAKLFIREENPRVSIVIPVFNQLDYTMQCIESINNTVNEKVELIVVNNASLDGTLVYLTNYKSEKIKLKIVDNSENLGFPIAINQGINEATGEYIIIVNNDIVVTDGWLERMIEVAESDTEIGLVGPISNEVSGLQIDKEAKYTTLDEMHSYAADVAVKNKGQVFHFPRIAFLCTLIKREVIEKIGGLDERFTPGNYEDDDFCLRAQIAGFKTVIAKDVFIHHYGSKSFKADGTTKYAERLKINEKKFVDKWGTTPDDLWLRNKPIKGHSIIYPIDKNIVNQSVQRGQVHIQDAEFNLALLELENAYNNYSTEESKQVIIEQGDLLNLLGNVSLIVGELEKAKNYFEEELSLVPDSSSACVGLGEVLFAQEQYEGAKMMYEWAIKNDPKNQIANDLLAKINTELGLEQFHNSLSEEV